MGVDTLHRRLSLARPARRVGRALTSESRRGELLAVVYTAGDLGVLAAWLVDPSDVTQPVALGALMVFVLVCAGALFALRTRLPPLAGDLALGGSVVLITLANLFSRVHGEVATFLPYFVWVGFAGPMVVPRRRAIAYVALAVLAPGVIALVARDAVTVAAWIVISVTLIVAFLTVDSLTRAMVEHERLAAVGEMASMVTHELRNPLGVVANALFLARHSIGDRLTPDAEQHLAMADREVDKANAIIDHLVSFVRPRRPTVEPVALAAVVNEVLETTPAPPGVRVRAELGSATASVDRGHLAEILVNLVSNAYDAMAGEGTLRIDATTAEHSVVVRVADDGTGLETALGERIFEPFFTTKHTGTGLGLAIVRRLVLINRGTVTVASTPGRGTTFALTLPSGRAAPTAQPGPAGHPVPSGPGGTGS